MVVRVESCGRRGCGPTTSSGLGKVNVRVVCGIEEIYEVNRQLVGLAVDTYA